jgi:hypothetical protein
MKKWRKPELIILVRNEPEEAVLSYCKGEAHGGSQLEYGYCFDYVPGLGCGNTCSTTTTS